MVPRRRSPQVSTASAPPGSEVPARSPALLARSGVLAAAVLLLGAVLACQGPRRTGPPPPSPSPPLHLVVLHSNDVHGQVLPRTTPRSGPHGSGGLPRLAAHVARVRAEESGPRTAVLAVDAGDWFQGTPEGTLDGGLGFLEALAAAGFDACAVGNHEFDLGLEHLVGLLEAVPRLPAVAANLRDPATGERVPWVRPWRIVRALDLDVALVGLVTPDTPRITHPDAGRLDFADPVEELGRVLAELEAAGGVDLVIPVGHIGPPEGMRLARAFPELPLVVTGHTHLFLREGLRAGRALVVQAGEKATVVGRVDLWLDPETLAVRSSSARLDQLEEPLEVLEALAPLAPGPARVKQLCDTLVARAEERMAVPVGTLAAPLTRGTGPGSTVAGCWIADLMRARTGADVAFHNRGGTRRELDAGPVTRRDVYELLPFDNHLVTLELDGGALEELVARSVGGGPGGLDWSGLTARVRPALAESEQRFELLEVQVGGAPLEAGARYTLTTNSFVAGGGDGYAELALAGGRSEDPILLRELVEQALRDGGRVTPPSDLRVEVVTDRGSSP